MNLAMSTEDWLGFLRREYLETCIREGGASTKFCVPLTDLARETLYRGLRGHADSLGYVFAEVDSSETRANLVDHIFFRVAEQIEWDQLGRRVLAALCELNKFQLPDCGEKPFYEAVAERNGMDSKAALILLRQKLTDHVFRRPALARDFRIAMFQICYAQLTGSPDGTVAVSVLSDWLTGRNKNISAVKPYNIFNRITRANARHFIESLFQWVRIAGYPGTIVQLDIHRVATSKNPKDDLLYYTSAALLDVYEVLREFIDATDRLSGSLLVVVPDESFLDEENTSRGIGRYEALKFRIYDEVRSRQQVNPMAALVRLSSNAKG